MARATTRTRKLPDLSLRPLDDRVISVRHPFGFHVAGRDEQLFVAVDAELDLETGLAPLGRRVGGQKRGAVFVDPEIVAAFFLVRRKEVVSPTLLSRAKPSSSKI